MPRTNGFSESKTSETVAGNSARKTRATDGFDAIDASRNYRQHRAYPGRGTRRLREGGLLDRHPKSRSGVHRRAELQQRLLEAPRGELRHGALLGQLVGVGVGHLLEVVQVPGEIM